MRLEVRSYALTFKLCAAPPDRRRNMSARAPMPDCRESPMRTLECPALESPKIDDELDCQGSLSFKVDHRVGPQA